MPMCRATPRLPPPGPADTPVTMACRPPVSPVAPPPCSALASPQGIGLLCGMTAYVIWGLGPLYFRLLGAASPVEIVACRTIFSVPLLLLMAAASNQLGMVGRVFRQPRLALPLVGSAALIAINWGVFVFAVQHGHVLATSLGLYINPLFTVLLGTAVLGERLSRRGKFAVGIAVAAVLPLSLAALEMLGTALVLAGSFAIYGLIRKTVPVSAVAGLAVETIVLAPAALAWLVWQGLSPGGLAFGREWELSLLLAGSGLMTVVPLLLFGEAARRLDLSTLGFIQYVTPTMTLLQGIVWFHEPLRPVQIASFALIWVAIGVFSWDMIATRRAAARP